MSYAEPSDFHAIVNVHQARTKFENGKPVGTIPAYKHREYPKMLYPKNGGRPVTVATKEEETEKLEKGWLAQPSPKHVIDPTGELVTPEKMEATLAIIGKKAG